MRRRLPIGAEPQSDGGVHFRVWAPGHAVEVLIDGIATGLRSEANGYHAGIVASGGPGSLYRYRLDGRAALPDPASRSQPGGPHGPSQVVDPGAYAWNDREWRGASLKGQVIYEMHVGTFTRGGTFAAARAELPRLKDVGVTLVEILPIAEFPGAFGWGYDGVGLFAPSHLYGAPDDLRRFVDAAHAAGIGAILDVVYNHFGPDGCYLDKFSPSYFTDAHPTDWGRAINFDGELARPVRELFVANAGYWIEEFHFDGLRLDATQSIHDESPEHVLVEVAANARAAARDAPVVIIAENEPEDARLVRSAARGGYGLDAMWNDDYHHAAVAAASGQCEAYYSDTTGTPQELIAAVKWGFLYQGQRYSWQKKGRGAPALDIASPAFVTFLENHDQVANTLRGARLWQRTSPGIHRALVALTLLAPQTPMLFQGEEFNSSAPFLYFADHQSQELAQQVREGAPPSCSNFPRSTTTRARAALDDPSSRATFERCKLDSADRDEERTGRRSLPRLAPLATRGSRVRAAARRPRARERDRRARLRAPRPVRAGGSARPREPRADAAARIDRGSDRRAPPHGAHWGTLWSSEETAYGGDGVGPVDGVDGWQIGGHQTTVLEPPRGGRAAGEGVNHANREPSGMAAGRLDGRARLARVARDERSRRVRLRNAGRGAHQALSRRARGVARGLARADHDAEPTLRRDRLL